MTEEEFKAAIPEAHRNDPALASFKDLGALAQSYIETKKFVGSSLRPPGPDASPEAKAEFRAKLQEKVPDLVYAPDGDEAAEAALWKRLGKPEKLEEYAVDAAATEAGLNGDELRALAAQTGLTKKQFNALVKTMAEGTGAVKAASAKEAAALKSEWGEAYEEKALSAKAAALKMGVSEGDLKSLTPAQLRVFANVAQATGTRGAPFVSGEAGTGGRLTPAEALSELADIRGNPAYWDDRVNPGKHEQLKARAVELTRMAHAG